MALTNEFMAAVSDNKKTRVRIMLKDIMLVDTSMASYNEMIAYAEKNMADLYDRHDGEELLASASEWTEDYMNQQMVSVVTNFSKERLDLLKKIVKYLYAAKEEQHISAGAESNKAAEPADSAGKLSGLQIAGGIVAVAGAGALIGGIVTSNIPVAIVGGVAILGGVAMAAAGGSKGV